MHLTIQQLLRLASLLMGVTLVGGMLIFCNVNRASIYNELVTLDLIPKPEKLTELYFNDNAHLPIAATSDQLISFAFVIHNVEMTDYQYVYDVSVNSHDTGRIVDSGDILVKNDQYYVKNEEFHLLNLPGVQEVVVELTNKRQSIDFRTGE